MASLIGENYYLAFKFCMMFTASFSAVAGVLLAIAVPSFATFPNGQLYPFDIDSLLTCHDQNPLSDPEFIPEEIIRLPFVQVVRQPPHPHDIWLPGNTT